MLFLNNSAKQSEPCCGRAANSCKRYDCRSWAPVLREGCAYWCAPWPLSKRFSPSFPALTAAVSLYGLVADRNMVEGQIMAIQGVLPPEAITLIATWLHALVQAPATRFGLGLIVSVLLALWSIWSATGMLMTAVTVCYGEEEKRGFVSFSLRALALSAGLALFGTAALALFPLRERGARVRTPGCCASGAAVIR